MYSSDVPRTEAEPREFRELLIVDTSMLAQSLSVLSRGRSGRCNSVRVGAVQTVRCHACRNI